MVNKWEIWDYESSGKHRIISVAFASVTQLLVTPSLITNTKKGKFGGNIQFDEIKTFVIHPISSYLKMGLRLSLSVGIDFTGSNGIPKFPSSLHYTGNTNKLNQYQQAIMEVGMILMDYSEDKMIPAYGFGAKLPGEKSANFCFPLNMNPQNPFVSSYQGLLMAYTNIVSALDFAGPTNFAPIIETYRMAVAQGFSVNKLIYSTLLILTDGLISDFHETVASIVQCSKLPMSIVIVGVGSEDFKQMDMLDSDEKLLTDRYGNSCVRDIVQFVPFRDYSYNPSILAEAVLRELPSQINQFYNAIGIIPSE